MNTDWQTYQRKMKKFNRWEEEKRAEKSEAQLLEEFLILFDLQNHLTPAEIQKAQSAHLRSLIDMQAQLLGKGKKEKGKENSQ